MAEDELSVEEKLFNANENELWSEKTKNRDAESSEIEEKDTTGEAENKSGEIIKPDGGWGWLVCLGAFICNFVVFGTHNSFGVIYGTLIKELSISSAETGIITTFYNQQKLGFNNY